MFTGFLCMMPCMASMAMGHVGMMPRLFMSSTLMMLGGFTMVLGGVLVMFGSLVMMVDACVVAHVFSPGWPM